MVTNICLLLEALSIIYCLHCLYGEKFKLDIATTSFLAIDMIIMTIINYYELSKVYTMIIYPMIVDYCGIRFGFKIKEMITNVIVCIIINGGIQMLVMVPLHYILGVSLVSNIQLLIVNCVALSIVVLLLPKIKIERLAFYLQKREKILIISLGGCFLIITFLLLNYKGFKLFELNQTMLLFISLAFILVLTGQASEYKVRAKEVETELKMHKLYADSFQGLVENIRLKQHEFDNHINTLYSQHYICKTYDELIKAQKDYCQLIMKENQFNKLLTMESSVVIGFLYAKFIEMDKLGINIAYKISTGNSEAGIPDYKIIEILGNLLTNAAEALKTEDHLNQLFVLLINEGKFFEIEVRNESPIINLDEIDSFFNKGYSKKGDGRGLGLYNVKCICEEYLLDIIPENMEIEGKNWLSFKVVKRESSLIGNCEKEKRVNGK